MSEYKLMQETGQIHTPMPFEHVGNLQDRVKYLEKYLFQVKMLAKSAPTVHGKVVISAQNHYRCTTCKNASCLNYGLDGAEGRIIRNQTSLNGCLEWVGVGL